MLWVGGGNNGGVKQLNRTPYVLFLFFAITRISGGRGEDSYLPYCALPGIVREKGQSCGRGYDMEIRSTGSRHDWC